VQQFPLNPVLGVLQKFLINQVSENTNFFTHPFLPLTSRGIRRGIRFGGGRRLLQKNPFQLKIEISQAALLSVRHWSCHAMRLGIIEGALSLCGEPAVQRHKHRHARFFSRSFVSQNYMVRKEQRRTAALQHLSCNAILLAHCIT
jgi:hypothetical protein